MKTNYYQIARQETEYPKALQIAKDAGYTHLYRWVNSDLNWTFFANCFEEAEDEAVQLYMEEKKCNDRNFALKYYSEFIDIIEIDEEIENYSE